MQVVTVAVEVAPPSLMFRANQLASYVCLIPRSSCRPFIFVINGPNRPFNVVMYLHVHVTSTTVTCKSDYVYVIIFA